MKATILFCKTFIFILCLLWIPVIQAHAFIEQSQPKTGEELNTAPKQIVLTFTKIIEPAFSSIQISNEDTDTLIHTGKVQAIKDEPQKLLLPLPKLSQGLYRVNWVALSRDGHRTMGDYTFAIR